MAMVNVQDVFSIVCFANSTSIVLFFKFLVIFVQTNSKFHFQSSISKILNAVGGLSPLVEILRLTQFAISIFPVLIAFIIGKIIEAFNYFAGTAALFLYNGFSHFAYSPKLLISDLIRLESLRQQWFKLFSAYHKSSALHTHIEETR